MPEIVLTTLNAKYAHAAFGLRYLMANLGDLAPRAAMLEFDIAARTTDVIEAILSQNPTIVGVGVYIWNTLQATQLVAELKRVRPDVIIVIGGRRCHTRSTSSGFASWPTTSSPARRIWRFGQLCTRLIENDRPSEKVIAAALPEFGVDPKAKPLALYSSTVQLPYQFYSDEDLSHRVVYVEASRGCPFKCEFCLSSLDVPVRNVPLEAFLGEMGKLLDRGCRQFKFVDRTFNLNLNIGKAILQFFLDRYTPGLFLHFEMIPDRLPEALRELIAKFPAGALQFEVGIQTLNGDVQHRISRKQDNAKLADNLTWATRAHRRACSCGSDRRPARRGHRELRSWVRSARGVAAAGNSGRHS